MNSVVIFYGFLIVRLSPSAATESTNNIINGAV